MSHARFVSVLKSARLRENDRLWFARWLDAYGKSCGVGPNDPVPVDRRAFNANTVQVFWIECFKAAIVILNEPQRLKTSSNNVRH